MEFTVKVGDRAILLDEAQLAVFVEVCSGAELLNLNKYVGRGNGTHGSDMEYTTELTTGAVHEWLDIRPMDMDIYGTIKLMQKLEKDK